MYFGVVLKEDGAKFSSSKGENIKLAELLNEGKKRAFQEL